MASLGPHFADGVNDRPRYSVADLRGNGFTDRAFGGDVHYPERGGKRRIYLLFTRDPCHPYFRTVRLRLGMSHCGPSGLLRLVIEKNRHDAEAVQVTCLGFCTADRGLVHVCMADGISHLRGPAGGTADPAVYESPDHDRILGHVPAVLGGDTISLYLRFHDRLFLGF